MPVHPLVNLDHQFLVDLYFDDEVSRYTAVIPELPGCVSEGETLAEARSLILEAASLYLESLSDMAADLPHVFPAPFDGLKPRHSTVVGLRDIAVVMEMDADRFMGSHVAMSNVESGRVVVFPVGGVNLSSTTITLLVHYAGIDAVAFLEAIEDAEVELEVDDDGRGLAELDEGPEPVGEDDDELLEP